MSLRATEKKRLGDNEGMPRKRRRIDVTGVSSTGTGAGFSFGASQHGSSSTEDQDSTTRVESKLTTLLSRPATDHV